MCIKKVDSKVWTLTCQDPSHNPPQYICLEPGAFYEHTCPKCKNTQYISSPSYTLGITSAPTTAGTSEYYHGKRFSSPYEYETSYNFDK